MPPCAFSDSDEELAVREFLSTDDDWFNDLDKLDHKYIWELRHHRVGRRVLTWLYYGDLLKCVEGEHATPVKNWATLPADERCRRWMHLCRMPEEVFDELYDVVCDHIPDTRPVVPHHRHYTKRTKLLVTVYYLAHVPTLRCMSRMFGIPHNSISDVCLRPGLSALEEALCDSAETKTVRFPRVPADLRRTMRQFSSRWHLPVVGAVDGRLIPQRMPSNSQAGGDANALWSY